MVQAPSDLLQGPVRGESGGQAGGPLCPGQAALLTVASFPKRQPQELVDELLDEQLDQLLDELGEELGEELSELLEGLLEGSDLASLNARVCQCRNPAES